MFPAVMPPGENATPAGQLSVEGELRDTTAVAAIGAHEVIIESPRHVDRMSSLSVQELRDVLETYAQRIRQWRDGGRFTYGLVFKNQGPRAGASLAHVHSQLVALSSVPPTVAAEYDRAAHQFRQYRSCPYCRIIEQERAAGVRMIDDTGEFVAFCPFASVQPFEAWLMPAQHEPSSRIRSPTVWTGSPPSFSSCSGESKRLCRIRPITCLCGQHLGSAAATIGAIGESRFCPVQALSPVLNWPAACLSIPSRQNAPPANSVRSSFFCGSDLNSDDPVN